MPLAPDQFHKILADKLPGVEIRIEDLAGDQDHYRVHVSGPIFAGKSRLEQQRICLNAIKGTEAENIHALSWMVSAPK